MDISNIVKNEVRNKDLASEIQLVTEKGIANALHDLYLSIINLHYAPSSSVYTKQETNTLLGNKQDVITGAADTIVSNNLNANSVVVSNNSGKVTTSSITQFELEYLDNCVDNVQDQLNAKQNTLTFDSTPIDNSTNPVTSNGIYDALSLKENSSNKVTSISSSSTDTQYPTAKLLYDQLISLGNSKQDTLTFDNTPTENSNNPVKSGGVYTAIANLENSISKGHLEFTEPSSGNGGYIDFHYEGNVSDYTSRIIEDSSGSVNILSPNKFKVNNGTIGYPDYTAGVSKTKNIEYTASDNVFINVFVSAQDKDSYCSLLIDSVSVCSWGIMGAAGAGSFTFFVKKGSKYKVTPGNITTISITEYPLK